MIIENRDIIRKILKASNKWNIKFKYKVRIRILSENKFLQLVQNPNISGFCKTKRLFFYYEIEIFVKQNNELFNQVWIIAHELFHAWQLFNQPKYNEKWLIEGSAEYFAQLITYSLGFKQLNNNYNPEYRSYFYNVKKIIENIGWKSFTNQYFYVNK